MSHKGILSLALAIALNNASSHIGLGVVYSLKFGMVRDPETEDLGDFKVNYRLPRLDRTPSRSTMKTWPAAATAARPRSRTGSERGPQQFQKQNAASVLQRWQWAIEESKQYIKSPQFVYNQGRQQWWPSAQLQVSVDDSDVEREGECGQNQLGVNLTLTPLHQRIQQFRGSAPLSSPLAQKNKAISYSPKINQQTSQSKLGLIGENESLTQQWSTNQSNHSLRENSPAKKLTNSNTKSDLTRHFELPSPLKREAEQKVQQWKQNFEAAHRQLHDETQTQAEAKFRALTLRQQRDTDKNWYAGVFSRHQNQSRLQRMVSSLQEQAHKGSDYGKLVQKYKYLWVEAEANELWCQNIRKTKSSYYEAVKSNLSLDLAEGVLDRVNELLDETVQFQDKFMHALQSGSTQLEAYVKFHAKKQNQLKELEEQLKELENAVQMGDFLASQMGGLSLEGEDQLRAELKEAVESKRQAMQLGRELVSDLKNRLLIYKFGALEQDEN